MKPKVKFHAASRKNLSRTPSEIILMRKKYNLLIKLVKGCKNLSTQSSPFPLNKIKNFPTISPNSKNPKTKKEMMIFTPKTSQIWLINAFKGIDMVHLG
jgi:hypothetical protein